MRSVLVFLVATLLSPTVAADDTVTRDTGFEVVVTAPPSVRQASAVAVTLALVAKDGRKLNEDYPFRIDVSAPADVRVPKARLARADALAFSVKGATFQIGMTPNAAGSKQIQLEIRFAMCTDVNCEPYRRTINVPLHVR